MFMKMVYGKTWWEVTIMPCTLSNYNELYKIENELKFQYSDNTPLLSHFFWFETN